jgi:hypothetical protein
MVYSLKELTGKLSPNPSAESLRTVKTNNHTLHIFQSLTGMLFLVNSDLDVSGKYFV